MTFAPDTISMSASSWCGYRASPRRFDHPAKASKTASGSGVPGSRSVSVMAESMVQSVAGITCNETPGVPGLFANLMPCGLY